MRRSLLAVLFLAASTAASGQVAEFAVSGGTHSFGDSDLGSGYSLDGGFRLAFRLTLNTWRFAGHEFGYAYNRTQLQFGGLDAGGMGVHQGFYNFLLYATPEGTRIRPFATGGGHFSNFVPPGQSATYGQGSNKFGVNYGGGLKFILTDKYAVRFDVRQFLTGKPFDLPGVSGNLRQTEYTVGFGIVL
ncbi:MAG: outer membrane beta-barrel protein [Bryobacteraceae bacterium]